MKKYRRIIALSLMIMFVAMAAAWAQDIMPSLSFDDEEPEEVAPASAPKPAATARPAATESSAAAVETMEVAEEDPAEVEPEIDVETARAKAITFFRTLAAAENADGMILPPVRRRKVVGRKPIDVRYTKKMVEVKKPIYKTVQEYRNVKVGDSVDAVAVRKKVKVQKIVGWERVTEEKKVRDPNGSIVVQEWKPQYGPGGPDEWHAFQFGHNAMAIFAMMRAGVDPQDEDVQRVAEQLFQIYDQYGMPDLTWDLAWSTAAFTMMQDEQYRELAQQMAGKLLDGQIAEGEAAGLWGPVCINTELLAAMLDKKARYSAFYLKAKAKFEAQRRDSYERKAEQALDALRTFEDLIRRVSMLAPRMKYVSYEVKLADRMGMADPIALPWLPSWIFNQRSADMESTAVAMFALRVAAEEKLIPSETWRPLDERRRPLASPSKPLDVLKRAVTTMGRALQREGWSELNQHQAVTDFDKIRGINGVPGDERSFAPLAAPLTGLSTVQGYAVFSYYASINGLAGIRPFARQVVAGNGCVKSVLDTGLEKAEQNGEPACNLCFFVSETPDLGKPESDLKAWPIISEYLALRQNDDGSWGRRKGSGMVPSSLRARRQVLPGMFGKKKLNPTAAQLWSQAHVDYNSKEPNSVIRMNYYYNPQVVKTAYALLALTAEPEE